MAQKKSTREAGRLFDPHMALAPPVRKVEWRDMATDLRTLLVFTLQPVRVAPVLEGEQRTGLNLGTWQPCVQTFDDESTFVAFERRMFSSPRR